ncbi:MAG: TonB-dependent receptor [candidate division Zixibacteria bacterium]|nr:TonB-dependent receptor [candidate division Zixibacteria bacterium]
MVVSGSGRRTVIRGLIAVVALGVLIQAGMVWGAVTGKVSGLVIDKKTKDPLIGCTVQIEGTTLGALSDLDGKYTILSVSPGEHAVHAKLIGHTDMITQNVIVKPDQTTVVDFDMEESAVQLQPIIVNAKFEMIQMDQASTKRDVTAEKIKTLPVVTIGDILKTQVGVTVRNDRFHIRGGRSSELLYTVDGVSMSDPLGGRGPSQTLSLSGTEIENVSIIKGAWSPEYGGTSGIVNVNTKEGDHDVTRGHVQYFTDNFGTSNLNKYSFNLQRLEFTLGGPEPLLTRRLLPALGMKNMAEKLSYFVSFDFNRSDGYLAWNKYTSPTAPATYRDTKFLGMIIPDREHNIGNALVKLTYRLHPDIRMVGQFKRSYERSRLWDWNFRYTPNTESWSEDKNDLYSVRWTHNLSPSTYYEILVSEFNRNYWERPGDPNVPGGTLNPDDFLFSNQSDQYTDVNGNGRWDPPESFIDVYPDGRYTFGDRYYDRDGNGHYNGPTKDNPLGDSLTYDFNGNGQYDADSGEPFADRNGNGVYDPGDLLTRDGNFNGQYDPQNDFNIYATGSTPNDKPEPFIDGDQSLGEPYEDINRNGAWDSVLVGYPLGEPYKDLSYDGKHQGAADPWVPGVPYHDLNGNGVFDPGGSGTSGSWSTSDVNYRLGDPFYDRNGNGRRDPADGFYDQGYTQNATWHQRNPKQTTAKFDLVSQVRREHEVKVGGTYEIDDLRYNELQQPYIRYTGAPDGGPFPGRGVLRDFYHQTPKTGAFYIVDKMEYGQMIAQVGFRYEYFVQSNRLDSTQTVYADSLHASNYRDKFAPRIAFSYPISDRAKVFFNYGHFYQLPELFQMYRRSTQLNSSTGSIGNVSLDFVKTIKYEFGVQYMLSSEYLLSFQGFYTDDFGRVSESQQVGVRSDQARNVYQNSDYSRARGFEVELEKKYGNYVSGSMTYDLSWAYGKSSAEALDYFDNFYNRTGSTFRIQEFPLDWDQRHKITFILDLRVPSHDHPKLFGLTLPDNFGLNVFWQYGSGFPYTPTDRHPGVARTLVPGESPAPGSERYPSQSNVDLRFNKDFKLGRLDYTFEIWVNNLFDKRDLLQVHAETGRGETDLVSNEVIYQGDQAPNPSNWSSGRQIRIGVGMNF